eukprot:TRINITY_DN572_c0_g1_i12.p1 TRINITY_DN572_c0_g1~~TRINITY_DN572_c0_g1_i12.p1  ORF type:complete len:112 (+),score=18.13 TRINITY_DN572_c0_g1_i12:92-427(+)
MPLQFESILHFCNSNPSFVSNISVPFYIQVKKTPTLLFHARSKFNSDEFFSSISAILIAACGPIPHPRRLNIFNDVLISNASAIRIHPSILPRSKLKRISNTSVPCKIQVQ